MVFFKRKKVLLILLFFFSVKILSASIISNFGRTGLLQTPTAYTVEDGSITAGISYVYPYLRGFINTGFFPGLEIGGTITVIRNINIDNGGYWSGYGHYKDKAFFFKYQILPEMGKYPAIAIGWDDFHGTKLFDTKYLVISKYYDFIAPQNITVGYAKGKLLNGLFTGTEILLHPKASLLMEYAPYDKKKLKGLEKTEVKTHLNVGLKFQPYWWLQAVFSIQRGKYFGFNINLTYPMGASLATHKPTLYTISSSDLKLIKENKQTQLYEKILTKGFKLNNVKVFEDGYYLVVEFTNNQYYYDTVAIKKILSVLQVLYFPNVKFLKLIIKSQNEPITEIIIPANIVNLYLIKAISFKELLEKSNIKFAHSYRPKYKQVLTDPRWKLAPKLRTFLNDPSGFFKYMLSLDIYVYENFLNNFRLDTAIFIPLINNISSANEPLMEKPVRSDIPYYLGIKKPLIDVLSISYIKQIWKKTFIGISAGYNELMFAGVGGDILYFVGDGRIAVGVGGDYVWKREPGKNFALKNWTFHDEYFSFYYTMKSPEIHINLKAGRFLAGDKGIRIEISRSIKGFEIGFWYTYSDTCQFSGPNKNYHDKGVFVRIPMRIFFSKDTKTVASYSLSPWTRDVGQLAGRPFDLYREVYPKMPFYLLDTADEKE